MKKWRKIYRGPLDSVMAELLKEHLSTKEAKQAGFEKAQVRRRRKNENCYDVYSKVNL